MTHKIPLSKAYDSEVIRKRILGVVESGQFILGPECKAFETELAAFLGAPRFVLSSSWTSAVHLLLLAMNLPRDAEVLMPSLTAFPSVEPVCHAGLKPVFVDIDDTYCMDPDDLERKITPRSAAVMPVHLYGQAAAMDRILAIARKHRLLVLEDCAQAIGARWQGKRVGSLGDAAGYSFYPSKNLTVYGDGGGISTGNAAWADKVASLRNHGRHTKFTHDDIGFNMRFNEIQAAVGREQLKVIDTLNRQRARHAALYSQLLSGTVATPVTRPGADHVFHMYVIETDDRDRLQNFLKEQGIETGIHYPVAVHQQPPILHRYGAVSLPKTERAVNRILSLPLYPALTDDDIVRVVSAIKAFFGKP